MSGMLTSTNSCGAEKWCNHCKKKVKLAFDCENCSHSYHKSCANQARVINKENKINCCQPQEREVKCARIANFEKNSDEMNEEKMKNIIRSTSQEMLQPFKQSIEREMANLGQAVQFMSDSYEEQKTKFEEVLAEIKYLRRENVKLEGRLAAMERKFDALEQKEKAENIVVSGVPQQQNEDTSRIMENVGKSLNIQSAPGEIIKSYRIGKQEHGPILVKLRNTNIKENIIAAIRKQKGTTVSRCKLEGKDGKIYINEDLTLAKRLLFRRAREVQKERGYRAVYCLHGKIFLRKNDGDPPIRITSEDDLQD